jgi:hypothetical protein
LLADAQSLQCQVLLPNQDRLHGGTTVHICKSVLELLGLEVCQSTAGSRMPARVDLLGRISLISRPGTCRPCTIESSGGCTIQASVRCDSMSGALTDLAGRDVALTAAT